jgi:hypothetical protein
MLPGPLHAALGPLEQVMGIDTKLEILIWARYICWADDLRKHYEASLEEDCHKGQGTLGIFAHWYGSLYVVVEGWDSLELKDPVIDSLLQHPSGFKHLLRRFRNGSFHYRPALLDEKILDLLRQGDEHVYWVRALHDEFIRFFREWLTSFKGEQQESDDLQVAAKDLLGVLPASDTDRLVIKMRQKVSEAEQVLRNDPPSASSSREAFQIKQCITKLNESIVQVTRDTEQLRRECLSKLGINIHDPIE